MSTSSGNYLKPNRQQVITKFTHAYQCHQASVSETEGTREISKEK